MSQQTFRPFRNQLSTAITDYVISCLPPTEVNSGLTFDAFTTWTHFLGAWETVPVTEIVEVHGYAVVTLTDEYLRLHYLDYCYKPTPGEYARITQALEDGDEYALYLYDVRPQLCGRKLTHLPNHLGLIEVPRNEITSTEFFERTASEQVRSHFRYYHQLRVDSYMALRILSGEKVLEVCSVFVGLYELRKLLGTAPDARQGAA